MGKDPCKYSTVCAVEDISESEFFSFFKDCGSIQHKFRLFTAVYATRNQ